MQHAQAACSSQRHVDRGGQLAAFVALRNFRTNGLQPIASACGSLCRHANCDAAEIDELLEPYAHDQPEYACAFGTFLTHTDQRLKLSGG
jgi:hypothetical protein